MGRAVTRARGARGGRTRDGSAAGADRTRCFGELALIGHTCSSGGVIAVICSPDTRESTMRVFVARATGAIGTRLVAQLIEQGHDVVGTFRSAGGAERVEALGAEPVALDLLDARAV